MLSAGRSRLALHQIGWLKLERMHRAFDEFIATYHEVSKGHVLAKDRTELLAFYAFPAEHWPHLRTTNPIERPSQPVRTAKTRCLSRQTMLTRSSNSALRKDGAGFTGLGEV